MKLLLLVLLLAAAALAWLALRRRAAARAAVDNDVRQVMMTLLVGELRQALEDPTLTPDDVESVTATLIAQMQDHNHDGALDESIADNQAHVAEELARRRAHSR